MKQLNHGGWKLGLAVALAGASSLGAQWDVTGTVRAEVRSFFDTPGGEDPFNGADGSVALEFELIHDWPDADWRMTMEPFARFDARDGQRRYFDLREFMFLKTADQWDLRIGVGKVFWGVTESQHLVDVINQTDFRETIDGESKLGQPMVNFDWITQRAGTVGLYYLPYFREREFPGPEGRLRPAPPTEFVKPSYAASGEAWHPGWAVRWAHSLGAFDMGVYHFDGYNREPSYEPASDGKLRPVYRLMRQQGVDLQWTHDAWLVKTEVLARQTAHGDHLASVSGFEYTFYGLLGSAIDVGLIGEYHHDDRGASAPTLFNDDLFAGARLAWNDAQDTSLLAGVFHDRERGSQSWRAEFQRRLGQNFRLDIEAQVFDADPRDSAMLGLGRDSFLRLELSRYF